jgi:inhibitor of KinA sporulation pathway (predicted exonuclease)
MLCEESSDMFEELRVVLWDTEFTSWPGCNENGWDNEKGEYREIIQIGAVKVDTESMEEIDRFNKFVKPQINPELSDYIKNLTGITQEDVNQAEKLKKVTEDFLGWSEGINCYSFENDWEFVKNNLDLVDEEVEAEKDRFRDVVPVFKEEGIPAESWHSGDIAKYIDENVNLRPEHDALNDALNMLKAFQLLKDQDSSSAS